MKNFDSLNIYILVPSIIFFYLLFQGYFSISNINKFLESYPIISVLFKFLSLILLISLIIYFFSSTSYVMGIDANSLPKPNIKVSTGNVTNTVQILDSNIQIPNTVATGLSNLGAGASIAAGLKGGATIAQKSGLSPASKMVVMGSGALLGGASYALTAAFTNMVMPNTHSSRKLDSYSKDNNSNNEGPSAFSVEPAADLDTIMSLLDANHIVHICMIYLSLALMTLYVSNKVIESKWNLIFLKNIFGERFYSVVIKGLKYSGKSNRIWMGIGWAFLMYAIILSWYVSYFMLNNIDIIIEIIIRCK